MIVGIAGSFASGKGTVVEYLIRNKGFTHYSASGFITEEIERRAMLVNRDSMIIVANDLRQKNGPTYIVDSLFQRAKCIGGDVVIESLRAVAEVKRIQALGGVVLGVDADSRLRYDRALQRKSVKDAVSYEQWKAQEKAESNPNDETKQDIFGALALADYTITNNGSIEELHAQIEDFLANFATK